VVVVLAYVIGVQAAALFEKWHLSRNVDQYHAQASEQTAAILRKMGTIEIGDTLPNFPFEDIDGKVRLLSEVVTDKTLITYIKPDCDACLVELERLKQAANGQEDYEHILLITSANPVHMQKMRAEYGLGCVILYDEERRFGSLLKISSFPFNLVVNRQRVIETIHANTLLPDDYERFFESTSHPESQSHPEPDEG
jgi:peroxiredoxin